MKTRDHELEGEAKVYMRELIGRKRKVEMLYFNFNLNNKQDIHG